MYLSADHLRDQVIRPALEYMGALSPANEAFLLNAYCAAISWLMQHRAGGVQAQPQSVAEARA